MPKFEFGRGNLSKVLALPLYGLGALATALVPRRPDRWVFGSGIGVGEGALVLWEYARQVEPNRRYTWLVGNERDHAVARRLGIEVIRKDSWRGWWATARARVVVVTHGFGDVNRYATGGAFIVQMWHGIPYKKLHLDSPQVLSLPLLGSRPPARFLMTRAYQRVGKKISLFPVASNEAKARIESAFGIQPERVVVTGDSRDDVLAHADRESARELVTSALAAESVLSDRCFLYAPTWRDGQMDPAVPTEDEWNSIATTLDDLDATLLIRSHPLGRGNYDRGPAISSRIALLDPGAVTELTPVLPAVDCLITDFSSAAYDFALLKRPIIFFAPDAVDYVRSRGVYEPWEQLTGAVAQTTWADTLVAMRQVEVDSSFRSERIGHATALAERFHRYRDGRSAQRVYEAIESRAAM